MPTAAAAASKIAVVVRLRPLLSGEDAAAPTPTMPAPASPAQLSASFLPASAAAAWAAAAGSSAPPARAPTVEVRGRCCRVRRRRRSGGGGGGCSGVDGEGSTFVVDACLPPERTQADVYAAVARPLVDAAQAGRNASLLAYGPTGAGKTYTVFGTPEAPGVVPRVLDDVCGRAGAVVSVAMVEVSREKAYDLLAPAATGGGARRRQCVEVRGTSEGGFYAARLTRRRAATAADALRTLARGAARRLAAPTLANSASSRSHVIVEVSVGRSGGAGASRITVVDLAGSESVKRSGVVGDQAAQAGTINLSLLELGRVVQQMAAGGGGAGRGAVSFRGSTLTKLLQECVSGDSLTTLLVAVSPLRRDAGRTVGALQFADRVKQLSTRPVVAAAETTTTTTGVGADRLGTEEAEGERGAAVVESQQRLRRALAACLAEISDLRGENERLAAAAAAARSIPPVCPAEVALALVERNERSSLERKRGEEAAASPAQQYESACAPPASLKERWAVRRQRRLTAPRQQQQQQQPGSVCPSSLSSMSC